MSDRLVGRQRELLTLDHAAKNARAGRGGVVFLAGEDGIGKSRLAAEVVDRSGEAGMCVLRGRSSTIGSTVPLRPFIEIMMQILRRYQRPEPEWFRHYHEVLAQLISKSGLSGENRYAPGSLMVFAEAFLGLTSFAGRHCGCLVVLEDLHDADPATLSVVEYLVDNLGREPTMLLVTVNTAPSESWAVVQAIARRTTGRVIELDGLSRIEVCQLLGRRLGVAFGDVPTDEIDEVWDSSGGNPFVAQELLRGMVADGPVPSAGGYVRSIAARTDVPRVLVDHIVRRINRLGPQTERLLSAAAVLGHRFPLSVVKTTTGLDDRDLLPLLRDTISNRLICADLPTPDWYRFSNALTANALLCRLTPADRAVLARRSAEDLVARYPGLPGDWCLLAATLLTDAGDQEGASRTLVDAGTAALASGAVDTAVGLLERAWELSSTALDPSLRADILTPLLSALTAAGQVDRAARLVGAVNDLCGTGLAVDRLAALHTGLAVVATVAGRWADALDLVCTTRAVLGQPADDLDTASVDVVEAYLLSRLPTGGDLHAADRLARRVTVTAHEANLPVAACQAWHLRGQLARERGSHQAVECFETVGAIAKRHRMPLWTVRSLVQLGHHDWLAGGDLAKLELAGHRADQLGARPMCHEVNTAIALQAVLSGQFTRAEQLIDQCWREATALGLTEHARQTLMLRAIHAAHQGQRQEMEYALAEFPTWAGEQPHLTPLTFGLARAFCALLMEDRAAARDHVARAVALDAEHPGIYPLAGGYGLHLLLAAIDGDVDWRRYRAALDHPTGQLAWNHQFVLLTGAVLLGRRGQQREAVAAVERAQEVGKGYEPARYLGLRLVAEAACAARWGESAAWLRLAEDHFHTRSIPAVASACRTLLRRTGIAAPRRRAGGSPVPHSLRVLGVTTREYEVFELLAEHCGNQAIADRLHISPRTVEKHVGNLLVKIGQPNRWELGVHAADIREGRPVSQSAACSVR